MYCSSAFVHANKRHSVWERQREVQEGNESKTSVRQCSNGPPSNQYLLRCHIIVISIKMVVASNWIEILSVVKFNTVLWLLPER